MKKNLMTKLLGMVLVCFCCMFMLKGATVSAAIIIPFYSYGECDIYYYNEME